MFFIKLININYGFEGLDDVVYLVENYINTISAVSLALASTVIINFIITFVFIIAALYYVKDF